jgi:hypothetical protein
MPHLTCVRCEQRMTIAKTGVVVVTMFNDPPQPYELWEADAWRCEKCQTEIVAGYGRAPFSVHWRDNFAAHLEKARRTRRVIYEYEPGRPMRLEVNHADECV